MGAGGAGRAVPTLGDLAGYFEQETPPGGRIRPPDPQRPRLCNPSPREPGPQPLSDIGWEVPYRLTRFEVHPDLGFILDRRVGYKQDRIAVVEVLDMSVPSGEHSSVHRGAEVRRMALGKRGRNSDQANHPGRGV